MHALYILVTFPFRSEWFPPVGRFLLTCIMSLCHLTCKASLLPTCFSLLCWLSRAVWCSVGVIRPSLASRQVFWEKVVSVSSLIMMLVAGVLFRCSLLGWGSSFLFLVCWGFRSWVDVELTHFFSFFCMNWWNTWYAFYLRLLFWGVTLTGFCLFI